LRKFAIVIAIAASFCSNAALAREPQPKSDQPSPAQPPVATPPSASSDSSTTMIGAWEFSNADHDKLCRFNFRADAAPGGHRLDVDKNCPNFFPSTKDIVGWSIDSYGSLSLLDAAGNSVIDMTEVEGGMYDGFTPEEGRYILQTAAAAPVRSADDMTGDWGIAHGTGKPICMLTLANSPAGGGNLALKIKPGCDPLVTRFNPSAWRMEQGQLVLLSSRGQSWQFEENDANTWQRVPETADPILLVRQ
jgi:hypothetical protein